MHVGSIFRAALALGVTAALLVTYAGPAGAHGDLLGGSPIPGSTVASAPPQVRLTFSEPPNAQSAMMVRDGCQRDVTRGVTVDDHAIVASGLTGQPGGWTVDYAIATDDGHVVRASTSFQVSGSKDCDSPQADDQGGSAAPASNGTSRWLILLGAAAGLILAGALTARLLMRRGGGAPAGRPGT